MIADVRTMAIAMKGSHVLTNTTRMAETNANRESVTRSPRALATGGAMLSAVDMSSGTQNAIKATYRGQDRNADRVG